MLPLMFLGDKGGIGGCILSPCCMKDTLDVLRTVWFTGSELRKVFCLVVWSMLLEAIRLADRKFPTWLLSSPTMEFMEGATECIMGRGGGTIGVTMGVMAGVLMGVTTGVSLRLRAVEVLMVEGVELILFAVGAQPMVLYYQIHSTLFYLDCFLGISS